MPSSAQDLATVRAVFADEANTIRSLIAQARTGDRNSAVMLNNETLSASEIRASYLQQLPDADTSLLDTALQEAAAFSMNDGRLDTWPVGDNTPRGQVQGQGSVSQNHTPNTQQNQLVLVGAGAIFLVALILFLRD